jgi:protein gp37
VNWGPGAPRRRTSTSNWRKPLAWNAAHAEFFAQHGRRQRVFCASLADVFDNAVPDEWRADLFTLIEQTPNLDWLLLTKRIGNAGNMLPVPFDFDRLYPNVLLGASIVTRPEMLRDAPKLKAAGARVTFWSVEPMLEDLGEIPRELMPDWVIVGGESGPGARPMHPDWVRNLHYQCKVAGVPFLFKQWGEWTPGVNVSRQSGIVDTATWFANGWTFDRENLASWGHADDEPDLYRIGKKAAGRRLDGVQHTNFPETQR